MNKTAHSKTVAELLKRFIPYYKKYLPTLFLDLFCAGFSTLCDLFLPLILRYITNIAKTDLAMLTPKLILSLGAIYALLRIIDTAANFFMQNIGHVMGAKIETDMRYDAFVHIQNLPYSYFNNHKSGQILARVTTDLFDVTEFSHHCPEEFFIAAVKIIISFIILSRINISFTAAIFCILPVMMYSMTDYRRKLKSAQMEQRYQTGEINSNVENSILGAKVVKSFANEKEEIEKFHKENLKFLGIKKGYYKYFAGMQAVNRIFDGLMYLTLITVGGYMMMNEKITPSDLFIYSLYVTTLLATIKRLVDFAETFQKGLTGIERFTEIMDIENDIKETKNPARLTDVKGDIDFENVYFSYGNDQDYVLKNLNLSIKHGENVALVGLSGTGKTTISGLIPRFYDVTKGKILLDGIDIKNIKIDDLRNAIGTVQQDVYLFSGTIYENILYGKLDAKKQEVITAAKMAGAYDFIMELPDEFDTYIGERGMNLSGGQKQRISIARVFLKNPPLLILDEATSSLDNMSEAIVQKSLEDLAKGRTTITIAHRLSTIQNAERIIVLSGGHIAEQGTHEELMSKKGIYYDLQTKNLNYN